MEIIDTVFIRNNLVVAFAVVGAAIWISYFFANKLTAGRIHGSAIAIALGLLAAYWGGVTSGGSRGVADIAMLSGIGLMGLRNKSPQTINAGDTVWIPPGEEHWHGASATNSMTHIAIQEGLNGSVANWLEKVSDEQYSLKSD